jgi:hypothetical protein
VVGLDDGVEAGQQADDELAGRGVITLMLLEYLIDPPPLN